MAPSANSSFGLARILVIKGARGEMGSLGDGPQGDRPAVRRDELLQRSVEIRWRIAAAAANELCRPPSTRAAARTELLLWPRLD